MPILSWSYWFSLQARELMPSVKMGLLIAFAALIVLGIVARAIAKRSSGNMAVAEGGKRFARMAFWMGPLGLFFLWCTHELTYFFGARFWFLAWIAIALVWTVSILRFLLTVVPKKKAEYEERARIQKWLPKSS
jgi:phosphatidylglycerophosphate synthase